MVRNFNNFLLRVINFPTCRWGHCNPAQSEKERRGVEKGLRVRVLYTILTLTIIAMSPPHDVTSQSRLKTKKKTKQKAKRVTL